MFHFRNSHPANESQPFWKAGDNRVWVGERAVRVYRRVEQIFRLITTTTPVVSQPVEFLDCHQPPFG
jgi:hypothetical protein